jgi:hypothetical protein
VREGPQIAQVLLPQWPIETQGLLYRSNRLGRRVLTENRARRIAGKQMNKCERDERQSEEHGDRSGKSAKQICQQGIDLLAGETARASVDRPPLEMRAIVDVDEAMKVHRGVDVRWHEHHSVTDKRTLLLR